MKINNIQSNINPKIAIFKQKNFSTTKSNEAEQNQNPILLPNDPKYYQTLNHINFKSGFISLVTKDKHENKGLKVRISVSEEDKITLELDKNDSVDVFFDKDGNLDINALNFFAKYYSDFYRVKKEMYEKEKNILLEIINDNSSKKLRAINPKEDICNAYNNCRENQTGSYGESLLNSIMDSETKKDLAIRRLNRIDNEFKTYSITLAKELITILKLSKQKDGSIDERNFEEKLKIATLLTFYNNEIKHDYTDFIFHLSTKENGEIDLEFCRLLIEMLTYCTNGYEPQEEIQKCVDMIKSLKKANPEGYKEEIEEIIFKYQISDINPFLNN